MKTDAERIELNELCSALVDGTIAEAQRERLNALLLESEEARRFYVNAMHLSASLCEYADEMQMPEPDNIIRPSSSHWRKWVGPLAAAAVLMLGLWIGRFLVGGSQNAVVDDDPDSVARLSGAKECVWVKSAPQPGDELARGRRLELLSGYAEVTFDSGAQIVMEGPATLDLRSEWEAELKRGTVKANVPQEAVGFRVTHATVEVVDLGTEFSVTASEDGTAAEVFVLKGAVEVQPRAGAAGPQAKAVLHEKQARRFAKAGPSEVAGRDQKFERLVQKVMIERIKNPLAWIRWRFDEEKGMRAESEDMGFAPDAMKIGDDHERWVDGHFGNALAFSGQPAARLERPLKRPVRTVAFWVQLPQGRAAGNSSTMLKLPLGKGTPGVVQFSINSRPADGSPGALRLDCGGGYVVGSTGLLDGEWHHVAAVFSGGVAKNNKATIAIYVDGRLETQTNRQMARSKAETPATETLWLGGDNFHGLVDELVLTDRPLAPPEIRHLMRKNELVSPEGYAGN